MKKSRLLLATLSPLVIGAIFLAIISAAPPIPVNQKHVIAPSFSGAQSAQAADFDNDGDLDVVGAAANSNSVTWWENGNSWAATPITTSFTGAINAIAADIDGDGDTDVMAAGAVENAVRWWENQGGQFGLPTANTSPGTMPGGGQDDLLQVAAVHNGRSGDNDLELTSLALLFEESAGDPLSSAEANALIAELYIYLDDGSGVFEAGNDMLVTTVSTLSLAGGVQVVPFVDGDPNVLVAQGSIETFFVVTSLTADAQNQTPNQFTVTHLTDPASGTVSQAEDVTADIPLSLAFSSNINATLAISGTVSGTIYLPVVLAR